MFVIDDLLLMSPVLFTALRAAFTLKRESEGLPSRESPIQSDFGHYSVSACRESIALDPGIKRTSAMKGGFFYNGSDADHLNYLKSYLETRADAADGEDRRRILAFRALQGREGSTAAINTYDNQIFTWGTGWGGVGGLSGVMDRLVANSPAVVDLLAACGVYYAGCGSWSVDAGAGNIITDKKEALRFIGQSPSLLSLFSHLAKEPLTRDAVTDAQLGAFVAGSGNIPGSESIATQALFNFATHLKHWAPGYMVGLNETLALVPGAPSPERDKLLAPEIVKHFYGKVPAGGWTPDWKQMHTYFKDMRNDGLDVMADPVIAGSDHPPTNVKTAGGCGQNWSSYKTASGEPGVDGALLYTQEPLADPFGFEDPFKTAGGCGNFGFPDLCMAAGTFGPEEPAPVVNVKVVGGEGDRSRTLEAKELLKAHIEHAPWFRGIGVGLDPNGKECVLVNVSELTEEVRASVPVKVGEVDVCVDVVSEVTAQTPPGFEQAHEVFEEPEFASTSHADVNEVDDHTAGGWGETIDPNDPFRHLRRAQGPAGVTAEQAAVIKKGIVAAVRDDEHDTPVWTQIRVGDYDLMVMNEPLAVKGLRLPTSFDDALYISNHFNVLPITPAISDARFAQAKQVLALPLNDATGALHVDAPGGADQVVRYNARFGPNTGEFKDGFWKELVLHPGLQPKGKGSMAQYGFKDSATHMFEHGGPSNHDKSYKDYSDTPTYVSRQALKNGEPVDLLDELAVGNSLGGPIPSWLVQKFRSGEVGV